jgi:hypothetical protein
MDAIAPNIDMLRQLYQQNPVALTQFGGGSQNNFRLSTGILIKF